MIKNSALNHKSPSVLVVATSRKTRGGITSVILAHEQGQQWKDYNCKWIETHIDKSKLIKMFYFAKSFIQYVFLLPFSDIVHIHFSEPPSAMRKLPFMWLARILNKKTIVHFHSFSVETTIDSRWSWVYYYHFTKADIIITLSKYWKEQVSSFLNDITGKVRIVYNPCPVVQSFEGNRICKDPGVKKLQKHVILYAGTITPRKGYADLIRAFATIAKNHKDWIIAFAGNGEIEKGQALAESLGISSQTKFFGWCRGADKDRVFREASIFCLPSYAEGFPMAVLDAWAYGLPVITTPVGGIPDIAMDGDNLLLFCPGDVDALANRLERLIIDFSLREKIGTASRHFAANEFNIATINNNIGLIYNELCNR